MRPRRLRLRGFGAFRAETEVDFADADVFALVGPTGAGKSTIIDAICFALYGNVPRYGERAVEPVVSLGANEAAVELTFELGDATYIAARVVRRTGRDGRATTREARLGRLDDGVATALAGSAREMGPAVEQLLGLTFEHFTRCVVLPQGEFARFLHDRPADRQELLERLLGLGRYDAMAKQANQQAAEARNAATYAEQCLASLPAHDAATRRTVRRRVAALAELSAALATAGSEVAVARVRADEARQRVAAAAGLAASLGAVGVPPEFASLGDALERARAIERTAAADLRAARQRVVAATQAAAALPAVATLEAARHSHRRLRRGAAFRAERAATVVAATAAREEADAALAGAERAEADGRAALDAARSAHAAHALARRLVAGEPCPVCGHPVGTPVALAAPPELAALERAVPAAETATRAARTDARRAADRVHDAERELAAVDATIAELQAAVGDHRDEVALDREVDRVRTATAELEAAREAEEGAADVADKAAAAAARISDDLSRGDEAYHRQRDAVAAAGPPPPGADLLASWAALSAWASDRQRIVSSAAAVAERDAIDADAHADALTAAIVDRAAALSVPAPGGELDRLAVAVARAEADAVHAVAAVDAAREEAARLDAELAVARERFAVAGSLGRHLSASGFPRWLVLETMDAVVADASQRLDQLSAGQYALAVTDDGSELSVVDHANADELRSVRSLSGGETFQASLALALALADHLASMAGRAGAPLDAIFLDEGFGTLDSESLEAVAAAIEALAGAGRTVGIVTHVPELAARVPVRFVVRKGPRTAEIERVVA